MDDLQGDSAAVVSEWEGYDDASLFAAIADWEGDEELAKSALAEIHRRYQFWVAKWAGIEFHTHPIPGMTEEDIQQEVWMKIQRNAGTFRRPGGKEGQGSTHAWLRQVIRNAHIDALRHRVRQCLSAMPDEGEGVENVLILNPDSETLTPAQRVRTQVLLECLQKLPDRTRTVVERSSKWLEKGEGGLGCTMPKELQEALAHELGTTTQNLRQLRSRGLKKVKECAEKNIKNKGAQS